MPDFPKLLVATEFPPNVPGGGGAIVRQLLKDWPVEKLFWWSCQPDVNQLFGQRVAGNAVAVIPRKLNPLQRGRALKSWLLEHFWTPWAARHFRNTLKAFQPEAVWVIPNFWSIPPLANALLRTDVAFHLSIYDYPDIRSAVERFGAHRCRRMAAQVDQLYARALTRDTISQQMTDDLRARTGAAGGISRCGLEAEDFGYLAEPPKIQNGPIRIAYPGTVISEETVASFANVLGKIRKQLPRPLTLDFFGDHSYRSRSWFDSGWMIEHGNLAAAELLKELKECTWGFSPMDLTDQNARYNRFSLPTKFVSYLAAGLPVITLAHPESTVVKMASQYDVGLCATNADPEKFGPQLLAALSEPDPKTKHRPALQRCALAEFDARRLRAALYENFRKCAAVSR